MFAMTAREKVIEYFEELTKKAKILGVKWEVDNEAVTALIDNNVLDRNKPKNYQEIICDIGNELFRNLGINHPAICADKELGKHYDIVKQKTEAYLFKIPLIMLRGRMKSKPMLTKLTEDDITKAILYLNLPDRTRYGIQDLTDDTHVITITPIPRDELNYQVKIKGHFTGPGRSNKIEPRINTVVFPIEEIKKMADKMRDIERRKGKK